MKKEYTSAPLPFQGQKRGFVNAFKTVLADCPEDITIVDLFGGSGLLSHTAKSVKPHARVVYNDYDDYHLRLDNIENTNAILRDIREMAREVPRERRIPQAVKDKILKRLLRETGYVDYVTLSSSLLFSGNYTKSLEGLRSKAMYNTVRLTDYPMPEGYLAGVEIVHKDYRDLFEEHKKTDNVIFIVDPPYLSTDTSSYNRPVWSLSQYLNVLPVIKDTSFVYFTSDKSDIVELCAWIGNNGGDNPFSGAQKITRKVQMNVASTYTDIMLYKL